MDSIKILIEDGFDEFDVLPMLAIQCKLNSETDPTITFVGCGTSSKSKTGIEIRTESIGNQLPGILILPGHSEDYVASGDALKLIQKCYREGVRLFCICSGLRLLKQAGVGAESVVSCHSQKMAEYENYFSISPNRITINQQIVSIAGNVNDYYLKSVEAILLAIKIVSPEAFSRLTARLEMGTHIK
ncbi:hypothetical protein [Paludibacterium purpuratum]|uniref:DJ-1/PfpI family protein n=1 Tax=Paludibacterium purpuratum TaxID=1144873 RepID=A0A4R7B6I3_9NEIS|nr:hypothetical protein [Paludibacterium purpuratum]TDR80073.1 hypothetical protein DFP86_106216 [Paludibacterium purpuratum]